MLADATQAPPFTQNVPPLTLSGTDEEILVAVTVFEVTLVPTAAKLMFVGAGRLGTAGLI